MNGKRAYVIKGAPQATPDPDETLKNKLWLLFPVPPLLACERVLCHAAAAGLPEGCCRARPSITTTTHQRTSTGMDKASRALAEGLPPGALFSFRALAGHSDVSHATLHRRSHGGRSFEQKGQD